MHSFLMEAGRWQLKGNWLQRHQEITEVKGQTLVSWSQDNWFTMVTKLVFPTADVETSESAKPRQISAIYRGRIDSTEDRYSFVLQHSMLGLSEGEGWIAPATIVQRYWVIGDKDIKSQAPTTPALGSQCSGFENWYRLNERTYHLSSTIMTGHYLFSTMEALLEKI